MKTTTKLILLTVMVVLPLGIQAQQMNEKLAKKAGVVVLFDKNVNAVGTQGNVIYLRLKDKSRNDNWKDGVQEVEVCIDTKVKTQTLLPINDSFMMLDRHSKLFTTSTLSSGVPEFELGKTEDGQALEFTISDQYGFRKYKIVRAVFYKTYIDALSSSTKLILGIEDNPSLAWNYIAQMFKVYDK